MFRPPVGSGRGDEDESGRRRHSSRVKFLPLAWAGMPKTSFRKNSDSPPNARVSAFMRNVEANKWLVDPDLNIIKGSNKNKNGKLSDFTLYAKQWKSKAEDEDM